MAEFADVRPASDASGESKTSKGDWGYTIWKEDLSYTDKRGDFTAEVSLQAAHIFIKEMVAATIAIESICRTHSQCRILLGVDNTAAVGAIRARYSPNRNANELIKRAVVALENSGCSLDIVPLRSEDNVADDASRGLATRRCMIESCNNIFTKYLLGQVRCEVAMSNKKAGPVCDGKLRHEDTEDLKLVLDAEILERLFEETA